MPEIKKLEFKNLSYSAGGNGTILEDVSFEFPLNQIVWVNGAGGSGKVVIAYQV